MKIRIQIWIIACVCVWGSSSALAQSSEQRSLRNHSSTNVTQNRMMDGQTATGASGTNGVARTPSCPMCQMMYLPEDGKNAALGFFSFTALVAILWFISLVLFIILEIQGIRLMGRHIRLAKTRPS